MFELQQICTQIACTCNLAHATLEMSAGRDGRTAEANAFLHKVIKYLEKSIVLVATDTDGATYSTPDNLITLTTPDYDLEQNRR